MKKQLKRRRKVLRQVVGSPIEAQDTCCLKGGLLTNEETSLMGDQQ